MLAFVYIPIVQKQLDIFRETVWNHQRGRKQTNKELPTGIPEFIFQNPEAHGDASDWGTDVTEDQLLLVAEETSVLDLGNFINEDLYAEFSELIEIDNIEPVDAAETFVSLKASYLP